MRGRLQIWSHPEKHLKTCEAWGFLQGARTGLTGSTLMVGDAEYTIHGQALGVRVPNLE